MADIVIHRCTLHLVRHGGWSWADEPGRLAGVAVQALRRLLERELAALWPDDAEVEVATPIRVMLPVRRADLDAMADSRFEDMPATARGEPLRAALAEAVAQAVRTAAGAQPRPAPATEPRPAPAATDDPRAKLLALLVSWLQAGELEGVLRPLGESALEAWHRTLLAGVNADAAGAADVPIHPHEPRQDTPYRFAPAAAIAIPSEAPHRAPPDRPAARVDVLRARILAVVAAFVGGQYRMTAISSEFIAHLDRVQPLPGAPASVEERYVNPATGHAPAAERSKPAEPQRATTSRLAVRKSAAKRAPADGTIHSALPFLILGTLARTGYLRALDAMLSAARLADQAPLFATALAFKILEPPERGWRRLPMTSATAAHFAGLAEPASNADVADFARRAADVLPALDRVLADALAQGHAAGAPLLLASAPGGGWLLAEPDGAFPIAWADVPDDLAATVRRFGTPTLLVPANDAGGGLLTRLDRAGLRFLTDARPAPREPWRGIHRLPHERWWTNDAAGPEAPLVAAGRKLDPAAEALAASWQQLAVERRAVVPGEAAPLEVSVALAAAVALADVAWTLWRDAGATDPLLTLERFGDLDARIRVGADDILVKLPLGKRAFDLAAHGLLDDVAGVPWLAGRVVRFAGGSPR